MVDIREFIISLIYLSAAGALTVMLIPSGSSLDKHVKYIVSIMLVFFIALSVRPISEAVFGFFGQLGGYADIGGDDGGYSDERDKWIISESASNIEKAVADAVSRKFRISPDSISCTAVLDSSDVTSIVIEKLIISLRNDGLYISRAAVREYVSEMLDCECEVDYEGKETDH